MKVNYMAKKITQRESKTARTTPPAKTPEAREKQLIALAYDLAEERLRNGTATSQEVTTLLKLGTQHSKYELEKLQRENELLEAKKKSLATAETIKELYSEAIKAFASYTGDEQYEDEEL